MKIDNSYYVRSLIDTCLKLADVVDKNAEEKEEFYIEELGLGYMALIVKLRCGVKAIIELQNDLTKAKSEKQLAVCSERAARTFLEEMFGDAEVDTLNDEYKAKIKAFVMSLDVYKEEVQDGKID